jgi:prepilin-type N-terminal cleavage/methylation domain-containing protein
MKKKGFTLAEVLITLGIIGIVAALTIPALVAGYQKKEFITKYRWVYARVAQAIASSEAENGPMKTWDFGDVAGADNNERFAKQYFVPYIEHIEEKPCGYYYCLIMKNGVRLRIGTDCNNWGNENGPCYAVNIEVHAHLGDSAKTDYSKRDMLFYVDTVVGGAARVKVFNWCGTDRNCMKTNQHYRCSSDNPPDKRQMCGALLQLDGWEMKDDYPW